MNQFISSIKKIFKRVTNFFERLVFKEESNYNYPASQQTVDVNNASYIVKNFSRQDSHHNNPDLDQVLPANLLEAYGNTEEEGEPALHYVSIIKENIRKLHEEGSSLEYSQEDEVQEKKEFEFVDFNKMIDKEFEVNSKLKTNLEEDTKPRILKEEKQSAKRKEIDQLKQNQEVSNYNRDETINYSRRYSRKVGEDRKWSKYLRFLNIKPAYALSALFVFVFVASLIFFNSRLSNPKLTPVSETRDLSINKNTPKAKPTTQPDEGEVLGETSAEEMKNTDMFIPKVIESAGTIDQTEGPKNLIDNDPTTVWKNYSNQKEFNENVENSFVVIDYIEPFIIEDLEFNISWNPNVFYENEFGDTAIISIVHSIDNSEWTELEEVEISHEDSGSIITIELEEEIVARYIQISWIDGKRDKKSVWNGRAEMNNFSINGYPLYCNLHPEFESNKCQDYTTTITTDGEVWVHNGITNTWKNEKISNYPKYKTICEFKPKEDNSPCKIDTSTIFMQKGRKVEIITAYGRYWNIELFNNLEDNFDIRSTEYLTDVERYSKGPCKGKVECRFDTHLITNTEDGQLYELITLDGKFWDYYYNYSEGKWELDNNEKRLDEVDKYEKGPCKYSMPGSVCKFDTYSTYKINNYHIEHITAYNRQYLYILDNQEFESPDLRFLDEISIFEEGPCTKTLDKNCEFRTLSVVPSSISDSDSNAKFLSAAWTINGKTGLIYQNKYQILDLSNNTLYENGNILDLIESNINLNIDDINSIYKYGFTGSLVNSEQDSVMLISRNKYWIFNATLTQLISWGNLADHRYWQKAPSVSGIKPWEGEGVTAAWTARNGDYMYIVNKNKYWIQDLSSHQWIESGEFEEDKIWQSISEVDGVFPWEGNGITSGWTSTTGDIYITNGLYYWILDISEEQIKTIDTGILQDII
ncbi:hypothetical protein GF362_06325 [Candidatus Dojkabacteria bacterium]|nr:hypothetical protein [Candidatus Dojkabacteria bacterium]